MKRFFLFLFALVSILFIGVSHTYASGLAITSLVFDNNTDYTVNFTCGNANNTMSLFRGTNFNAGNPICPTGNQEFAAVDGTYTVMELNPVYVDGIFESSLSHAISTVLFTCSGGTCTLPVSPLYAVTGNVYNDANHNGIQDTGESNYSGATVTLSGAGSASTTTDTNGFYAFLGLSSGSYTVTLTDPTGYGSTTTNPVNRTLNSNATENFGITTTTKLSLTPTADDFVSANNPTTNYGTLDELKADTSPAKISYLKFDLSSLAGKTVTSAKIKVTTYSDTNATTAGPDYVYLVNDTSWGETTLNYNNRPTVSSTLLGTMTNLTSINTRYGFQLDPTGIQPETGGLMSIGITSGSSSQLHLYSRQATTTANAPKLIIYYY